MADIKAIIKNNKDDIIKPVAVLLAICIIIPLALSVTNKITAEKIARLETENSNKIMALLVKAESYKRCETNGIVYYAAVNGGNTAAYIFTESAKGYGGDVSVMTAVNTDGTVSGTAILDVSNETPGLGQNAAKEGFYSQFKRLKKGISLLKNGADGEKNEINAVTGATITSAAVTRAVNAALDDFDKVREAESGEE